MDDERLKEGRTLGADYFDELLERQFEQFGAERRRLEAARPRFLFGSSIETSSKVQDSGHYEAMVQLVSPPAEEST